MVNLKAEVEKLFHEAVKDDQSITEINDVDDCLSYYDEENDRYRYYHYNDTPKTVASRIFMDKAVEHIIPKQSFASFLIDKIDPNALMVMEKLVFLWDNEEGRSGVRDMLEDEYGDEYAQYIAEDFLGQIWIDRQIPVINVSAIVESCNEIWDETFDPPFPLFFAEAVLQTVFHECRHLVYECNEIITIGKDTPYPQNGGTEDNIEEYGNAMAHKHLHDFYRIVSVKEAKNLKGKR